MPAPVPASPPAHAPFLAAAGEPYRAAYAGVAAAVARSFPHAEPVAQWGMPGWRARRPAGAWKPEVTGTMDPDVVFVGLADRKAGPTLHLWHPASYRFLEERGDRLRAAGFKVMVGCLAYARKAPYPVEEVARLLEEAAALDRAGGAGRGK